MLAMEFSPASCQSKHTTLSTCRQPLIYTVGHINFYNTVTTSLHFQSIVTQHTYVLHLGDRVARLVGLGDRVGAGPSEDDQVEQRVGAETVGAVHGDGGAFTGGVQAGDDFVLTLLIRYHLHGKIHTLQHKSQYLCHGG